MAQAEEQGEENNSERVSRGVTQAETEEEQAHKWLTGAASLNEGVKDIILQEIVRKGDFPTAWVRALCCNSVYIMRY